MKNFIISANADNSKSITTITKYCDFYFYSGRDADNFHYFLGTAVPPDGSKYKRFIFIFDSKMKLVNMIERPYDSYLYYIMPNGDIKLLQRIDKKPVPIDTNEIRFNLEEVVIKNTWNSIPQSAVTKFLTDRGYPIKIQNPK